MACCLLPQRGTSLLPQIRVRPFRFAQARICSRTVVWAPPDFHFLVFLISSPKQVVVGIKATSRMPLCVIVYVLRIVMFLGRMRAVVQSTNLRGPGTQGIHCTNSCHELHGHIRCSNLRLSLVLWYRRLLWYKDTFITGSRMNFSTKEYQQVPEVSGKIVTCLRLYLLSTYSTAWVLRFKGMHLIYSIFI
jgi:hypothetical protein